MSCFIIVCVRMAHIPVITTARTNRRPNAPAHNPDSPLFTEPFVVVISLICMAMRRLLTPAMRKANTSATAVGKSLRIRLR